MPALIVRLRASRLPVRRVVDETREDLAARRLTRYIETFRRPAADAIGYRRQVRHPVTGCVSAMPR